MPLVAASEPCWLQHAQHHCSFLADQGYNVRLQGIKIVSFWEWDLTLNADMFQPARLVRYPLLEGVDADVLYRRAVLIQRYGTGMPQFLQSSQSQKASCPDLQGSPRLGSALAPQRSSAVIQLQCSIMGWAALVSSIFLGEMKQSAWPEGAGWVLLLCLVSLHGLEGTHVQETQCSGVVVKCHSPAASHCFSPVSRFVQFLESVLCYLIPLSEDSIGTFNALRVSMCRASLGWCQRGISSQVQVFWGL